MNPGAIRPSKSLLARIRALSAPLAPLPAGLPPHLPPLGPLRAVVFDVYGTLFISASGDIGTAAADAHAAPLRDALAACRLTLAADAPDPLELLHAEIQSVHAERRAQGVAYPEVEILAIWTRWLERGRAEGWLAGRTEHVDLPRLALEYECRANPVWPMPDLAEVIDALADGKRSLGIVSNAQFYTPLLFSAFLGRTPAGLGFDEDICIWSWQHGEGKPAPGLFALLRDRLAEGAIEPAEILYVGNDMRNDIGPAQAAGMRTALFAGDGRSLRLRQDDPACRAIAPDAVLTSLKQVLEIVV
jgi:putative hydrolase of the HAD superfamily